MKKGFTLIELMICVAILSILAAIAVPAFKDFLQNNKDDLKTIVGDTKEIVRDVGQPWKPKDNSPEKNTTKSSIFCQDGHLAIMVDNKVLYVGEKDNWGDIKAKECE